MPAIKRFVVTQTREVHVNANTMEDAVLIAGLAFQHGQNTDNGLLMNDTVQDKLGGAWGNTTSEVKVTDMMASLEY